ncbi:MAG: hypothetical protein KGQ46_02220 [Hyphomicrobiales bacterium]|nr:hypothetical protein [Hyphomicrobiales bacterium]MDE2114763.1 DUF2971 domain-containing protein [Hyphomicrobiales bacterium]
MKAYKFRSASQIQFALDIMLNSRLFCSDWRKLNDPMEGIFAYSTHGHDSEIQNLVKGIGNAKSAYKICSLSENFQSHLLWAHYAGGFDGVAIEIELPEDSENIRKIDYRGVFAFLHMDKIKTEDEATRKILFSKYKEWQYEREIRILSNHDYYQLAQPVRKIIVGQRMQKALSEALQIVCEARNIEFCRVGIGDEGIDADFVNPLKA